MVRAAGNAGAGGALRERGAHPGRLNRHGLEAGAAISLKKSFKKWIIMNFECFQNDRRVIYLDQPNLGLSREHHLKNDGVR